MKGLAQTGQFALLGRASQRILRALLRNDPDVIMVGDIDSLETAELSIGLAVTGHLVMATLHTHRAASAIPAGKATSSAI